MREKARPNQHGFYLITVKASQQAGLTGMKGSLVRRGAVSMTRSSLGANTHSDQTKTGEPFPLIAVRVNG